MSIFEEIAQDVINSRKEIIGSKNVDEEHESFGLKLLPCSFPSMWGFEIINSFSTVLKGLISTKDESCLVNILQTDSPLGGENEFRHNFFLSTIPKKTWKPALSIPTVNIFSFIDATTSGYPGSGPQVHEEVHGVISQNTDEIALRRLKITSKEHKALQKMVEDYGPILTLVYPHQMKPERLR